MSGQLKRDKAVLTVVVADDEEELRKALIRKVDWESIGFSVVGEAENGAEALELVEQFEPDLLLTDIRMPFISGIELARQVREVRPATQIAFLSGYDDFTYAQQAIQYNIISYLLKPISAEELTEELISIKEKIYEKYKSFSDGDGETEKLETENIIMPWLLDGFTGEDSEEKNRERIQTALDVGLIRNYTNEYRFAVMVVSILDDSGKNVTSRASINAVDSILKKYVRYASFYSEGRVISLLMASQSGFDKYLYIIVNEISQSIKRIMDMSGVIGVSRCVKELTAAHEAYIEAMNALSYSEGKDNGICFISDMERGEEPDIEKVDSYISEVEYLLRGGSRAELDAYLNEMFDSLASNELDNVSVQLLLAQLASTVMRGVYTIAEKDSASEFRGLVPIFSMPGASEIVSVRDKYISFCLEAKDFLSEQRKKSSTVLCDKAIGIIESQYMNPDISLVSVSSEIAVSPNYLSTLIKKQTGRTFIDLLTQKRIDKAKDYLMGSTMKIREIAEKCGYNDQHYFSYCFKKYTGYSPNACRQSIAKDE